MLSENIMDYYVVSQGKTSIPGVDDAEELTLTDVRPRTASGDGFYIASEMIHYRSHSLCLASVLKALILSENRIETALARKQTQLAPTQSIFNLHCANKIANRNNLVRRP